MSDREWDIATAVIVIASVAVIAICAWVIKGVFYDPR
jgi:hypothetical protein